MCICFGELPPTFLETQGFLFKLHLFIYLSIYYLCTYYACGGFYMPWCMYRSGANLLKLVFSVHQVGSKWPRGSNSGPRCVIKCKFLFLHRAFLPGPTVNSFDIILIDSFYSDLDDFFHLHSNLEPVVIHLAVSLTQQIINGFCNMNNDNPSAYHRHIFKIVGFLIWKNSERDWKRKMPRLYLLETASLFSDHVSSFPGPQSTYS